jgi:hypothetical protein
MREIFALAMMLFGLAVPTLAQTDETPWQDVVTGQIEAFRAGDGAAALVFAGAGFRTQFDGKPEAFIAAIGAAGYGPIVQSRSHSFGTFERVSETSVLQVVQLVGAKQSLYEAVYQLEDEAGQGWRVQGVVLRKQAGIAI